jgi:FkbH-like protein
METQRPGQPVEDLHNLLRERNPRFLDVLRLRVAECGSFAEALKLNTLLRKGLKSGAFPKPSKCLRLAIVGGSSLHPIADLVGLFLSVLGDLQVEMWTGEYDNYTAEILDEGSELYAFEPNVVVLFPSEIRAVYDGALEDSFGEQQATVARMASELLDLCDRAHAKSAAPIVLANFRLSSGFDPGPMRQSSLRFDYGFKKALNAQLGLRCPPHVRICDVEFLANRLGTAASFDPRLWFESKQPYSAELIVSVAREVAHVISSLTNAPKKLAILDLDNTLWGGAVGDDGVEGIEIGTTSPRGEAFRDFQLYLKSLKERGVLLAVASKNDHERAIEPFLNHPEMILQLEDFVSFKASWHPKSDSIREMAIELSLGLDSFVFLDDNPAEVEIVRQFVPEVSGICLGADPSWFRSILENSRLFESSSLTVEDGQRTALYQQEAKRQALKSTVTDMGAYLESLEMVADISPFSVVDAPRISQLINKSNQFNLTTRRRTEAEVLEVISDSMKAHFTIRLSDRFGGHGIIAIVIASIVSSELWVDTWLMSCRVLKRQVEDVTLNEIVRQATDKGCDHVIGKFIPTAKNSMVEHLYPSFGFELKEERQDRTIFSLDIQNYASQPTRILVNRTNIHD